MTMEKPLPKDELSEARANLDKANVRVKELELKKEIDRLNGPMTKGDLETLKSELNKCYAVSLNAHLVKIKSDIAQVQSDYNRLINSHADQINKEIKWCSFILGTALACMVVNIGLIAVMTVR